MTETGTATKHEIQVHDHAPMPDPWAHWRKRVAGERVPVFEGEPQWGYYRWRQRIDRPVAIFEQDGQLVAVVGKLFDLPRYEDPKEIWTSLAPIPKEIYDAAAREGKSFASAAMVKTVERPVAIGDGRAWREAKTRIIEAAAKGVGVRLTPTETAAAAAEFGSE